jgi:hypothetical protein
MGNSQSPPFDKLRGRLCGTDFVSGVLTQTLKAVPFRKITPGPKGLISTKSDGTAKAPFSFSLFTARLNRLRKNSA